MTKHMSIEDAADIFNKMVKEGQCRGIALDWVEYISATRSSRELTIFHNLTSSKPRWAGLTIDEQMQDYADRGANPFKTSI